MAWYNDKWKYRVPLTIESDYVADDVDDTPFLIDLSNMPSAFFTNVQSGELSEVLPLRNDASLQGYWKLESDGTDETLNNNDLTGTGTPSHAAGKFGNGADLEASTPTYYSIADGSQTGLDIADDLSIVAHIKIESLGALRPIATKYDQNAARSYRFDIDASGQLELAVSDDGTTDAGHFLQFKTDADLVVAGNWYHVAVTFDISEEECIFYVNGVEMPSSVTSGSGIGAGLYNTSAAFAIGADYDTGAVNNKYDGIVDDVAVFSRVLAEYEVWTLARGGGDVRVTKSDGETLVPTEMTTLDVSGETGQFWFKYSSTLSGSTDTTIYMYYGNSNTTAFGKSNAAGRLNVWTLCVGVYHLEIDSFIDATENNHATNNGTTDATGQIGGGKQCSKSSDYFIDSNYTPSSGTVDQTILCWGKITGAVDQTQAFMQDYSGNDYALSLAINSGTNQLSAKTWDGTNNPSAYWDIANLSQNTWYHIAGVRDQGSYVRLFVDGDRKMSVNDTSGDCSDVDDYGIGNSKGSAAQYDYDGIIDEVWFLESAQADEWITTVYNNQKSNSAFIVAGTQETLNIPRMGFASFNDPVVV